MSNPFETINNLLINSFTKHHSASREKEIKYIGRLTSCITDSLYRNKEDFYSRRHYSNQRDQFPMAVTIGPFVYSPEFVTESIFSFYLKNSFPITYEFVLKHIPKNYSLLTSVNFVANRLLEKGYISSDKNFAIVENETDVADSRRFTNDGQTDTSINFKYPVLRILIGEDTPYIVDINFHYDRTCEVDNYYRKDYSNRVWFLWLAILFYVKKRTGEAVFTSLKLQLNDLNMLWLLRVIDEFITLRDASVGEEEVGLSHLLYEFLENFEVLPLIATAESILELKSTMDDLRYSLYQFRTVLNNCILTGDMSRLEEVYNF